MKINISVIMLFKTHMRSVDYEVLSKHNAVKKYCSDYCNCYKIHTYEQLKTNLTEYNKPKLTISNRFMWNKINKCDYYSKLNDEVLTILKQNL